MRQKLILITVLFLGSHAAAEDSCALRAAKLFASGQSADLATWFSTPDSNVTEQLSAVTSQLGALTEILEATQSFSGPTTQRSVVPSTQPSAYRFIGTWASARSDRLGAVRIQASTESSTGCKLLALHIYTQRK